MDKINVIHHMNEFRNILSYATNIGFFFGALYVTIVVSETYKLLW